MRVCATPILFRSPFAIDVAYGDDVIDLSTSCPVSNELLLQMFARQPSWQALNTMHLTKDEVRIARLQFIRHVCAWFPPKILLLQRQPTSSIVHLWATL